MYIKGFAYILSLYYHGNNNNIIRNNKGIFFSIYYVIVYKNNLTLYIPSYYLLLSYLGTTFYLVPPTMQVVFHLRKEKKIEKNKKNVCQLFLCQLLVIDLKYLLGTIFSSLPPLKLGQFKFNSTPAAPPLPVLDRASLLQGAPNPITLARFS